MGGGGGGEGGQEMRWERMHGRVEGEGDGTDVGQY